MHKGFAAVYILVGILVLAAVAGGIYYFGKSQAPKPQVQNPTVVPQVPQPVVTVQSTLAPDATANPDLIGANWKTYRSQYFSIQHPNSWEVRKSFFSGLGIEDIGISKTLPETDKQKYEFNEFLITVSDKTRDEIELYINELLKIEKTEEISIDGKVGEKMTGLRKVNGAETGQVREILYLDNQDKKYVFIFTTSKSNFDEFHQILSTFRFLP